MALLALAQLTPPPEARPKPAQSPATGAIVIVRPPTLFGGSATAIAVDGKSRKHKVGRHSLAVNLQPGTYDFYGAKSPKPRASITIAKKQFLYVADRDDAVAQRALQDLRRSPTKRLVVRSGTDDEQADRSDDSPGMASIILVGASWALGGDEAEVLVDGKQRSGRVGQGTVEIGVVPGRYVAYPGLSPTPATTVIIGSGELSYVVNRANAGSQRQLGDIFFESGNRAGALALYRGALATDPSMTSLCKRYADLAVESKDSKEAIAALRRVISVGLAESQTYQTLGDLLAAANRPDEAKQMYDKALSHGGQDAKVLTSLAVLKQKTGDLKGAAQAYEEIIELERDSIRLYTVVGSIYLRLRDTAKVIESYRAFLAKGGKSSAIALFVGTHAYQHRLSEDAVRYLTMVTGKEAQKIHYLRMLGESHYRLGDYPKACEPLRVAAKKFPKSVEWPAVADMLVQSYMALKDYAKAEVWIEAYAKAGNRQSADVAYYRAFLKERTSPKAAQTLYEQNTVRYPGDYRNYLRCGIPIGADQKSLSRSVSMLKQAMRLADTVPDAWLEISRVYRKLGQDGNELSALQVFVTTHPQHPEANARMGELMMRKGDVAGAMEKLQSTGRESSDDPAVLKALAQGYALTGKNDDAIAALERARKAAPEDTSVRMRLVDIYRSMGLNRKALEEYRGLAEIRRDNATLLVYATLLYENKRIVEADSVIQTIRATQPDNIEALMLLGDVLRAQDKLTDAIEVYQEISFIDPKYIPAIYERAETHLDNGQPHWAESFYKRTLERSPKFARAELGLARVAKLRRDRAAYDIHASRAYALAPHDPAIQQEYEASVRKEW